MRIGIVGGGVIGLSIAHELTDIRSVERVTVYADAAPEDTTSAVAGAIWFPHSVEESPRAAEWSATTLARLTALAKDPGWGILLREGTHLDHGDAPDRSWTAAVPWHREVPADELPPGVSAAVRTRLPVINMPTYLSRLAAVCGRRGVRFVRRRIRSLGEIDADIVVLAAGLGSADLVEDDDIHPVRGQIVRVANPGLTDWVIDGPPQGRGYVFPRQDDIVLGGSSDAGEWDTTPDLDLEQRIVERAVELVPTLRGLPVVSRAVGLRPVRSTVRFEMIDAGERPVLACYGHGGAGVTLSWGCAADAAEMVRALSAG